MLLIGGIDVYWKEKVASPDQHSLIKDYLESFPRREKASFNGKNTWSAHSYVFAE